MSLYLYELLIKNFTLQSDALSYCGSYLNIVHIV